jgi:hypothetical protein
MTYKNLPKDHEAYFDFTYLTLDQKGYWAGLLDGEGCLRMDICSGAPLPSIAVKMTCEKTIQKWADTFGLNASIRNRKGMKDHWKDCYSARMTTHKAAKLCEAILPYFVTKQDVAKEMAEHYVKECEVCKEKFWQYNGIHTCSKECQHIRKLGMTREYNYQRYHADKKKTSD